MALILSMFSHIFFSQIHRQLFTLFFFSPCSAWHTTQRLSQLFSILTGCKCDYYIAHSSYLPQVCLNTNYRSITCLKSNYFLKCWQGANNFVLSIVAVQTKTTNTWIPKYLQLEKNSERIARVPIFLAMTLHKMWSFKWARHPNVSQVSLIEESMKKQCQTIIIFIMWP